MADNKIDWGALLLGAGDELLFGIPEWAGKNLAGPEVRKKIEDWIAQHPQYHTGETIGTVASIAIPVGGFFKAGKLADTVIDAAKITGKVARPLAKGALMGATEGVVRGVTSEMPIGDIAQSALIGGVAGGIGGAWAGQRASRAVDVAEDLTAAANRAELAGQGIMQARDAKAFLREFAGKQSKGFGRKAVSDEAIAELARVSREINPRIPGNLERAIAENKAVWTKLSDSYNTLFPGRAGIQLVVDAATEAQDDFARMGTEVVGGSAAVNGALQDILQKIKPVKGVENVRRALSDITSATFKDPDALRGEVTRAVAGRLRSGVDAQLIDAVSQKTGDEAFRAALTKAKRDYLPMRYLADADARGDVVPTRTSIGSTTAEKLGMQGMVNAGILGAAGYAGSAEEDPQERLKKAGITAAAGFVGGMIANPATRALASGIDLGLSKIMPKAAEAAEKVAPLIAKNPEVATVAVSRLAGTAARIAVGPKAPQNEAEAAQAGAAAVASEVFGQGQAYRQAILKSMQTYYENSGLKAQHGDAGFAQFAETVAAQTDGFNPRKMANVFYQTQPERDAYLKAVEVAEKIGQSWDKGLRAPYGLLDSPSDEERSSWLISRDRLLNAIGDAASKTGSAKVAKDEASKILGQKIPDAEKRSKLEDLLRKYGVDMEYLKKVGL